MCIYCNLVDQLNKVNDLVKNAGYQDDSMIAKGIAEILAIYTELQLASRIMNISAFTVRLITSILPTENSYYEIVRGIIKNFVRKGELACALIDLLEIMTTYRGELRVNYPTAIDNNFKKIFAEPEAIYRGEFDIYYYRYDLSDLSDSDSDSEAEAEEFNERYQDLAPPKEEQLDRLANELNLKLCEECLMPYKGQACDCWLQEIEEGIFSE